MKYAVQGPLGAINHITDIEPQFVMENESIIEITDEQATQIAEGRIAKPKVVYSLYEGELITLREKLKREHIASIPLEYVKDRKKAEIAAARYSHEYSGIELNGIAIPTDAGTQTKLAAAYTKASSDSNLTINWKTFNGFVVLDASTIIALGDAVFNHIQDCFNKEKDLVEQIDAATTAEEVQEIQW